MRPALKYWTFLFTIIAIIFAVLLGSFAGSWLSLTPAEQSMVRGLFNKLIPFPFLGALALVMILGTLVSLLFRYYIIPVLLLAEKARLITTVNPAYRIVPTGAKEVVYLTEVINDSAEAYQKMQSEVNEQIRIAKNELHEERNRLAALMAELPSGVLVCNIAGQILLYNRQAQNLLQSDHAAASKGQQGTWVGLGRSVFGLMARDTIVNALEWLQQAVNKGQRMPISSFMTTLRNGTCLRVSMTPVFKRQQQDCREMTGFVLSIEDMTQQIEADSRIDLLIQSLTDNMQKALDQIRRSIQTILQTPGLEPEELARHRKTIDQASLQLQQHLVQTRHDYALHQQEFGKTEDVLAEDLHQILQKTLHEHYSLDISGETDDDLHLQIDSHSFIQSISHLAGLLRIRENITSLNLNIRKTGLNQAVIELDWQPASMPAHLIDDWQKAPLLTDRTGKVLSLQDLVVRQDGQIEIKQGPEQTCLGASIRLPASHEEARLEISDQPEARPVNYEFDLFDQEIGAKTGKQPLRECTYVVFDTETTGLSPSDGDEIIQIGAIRIVRGRLLHNEIIDQLVDPQRSVPASSVEIHGIDPELLRGQPTIEKVLPRFHKFAEGAVLVAHNAAFDMKFLQLKQARAGVRFDNPVIDTLLLSSIVHPTWGTHSLDEIAAKLNVTIVGRHTALGDSIVTAEILLKLIPLLQAKGINTLEEARRASAASQYAKMAF